MDVETTQEREALLSVAGAELNEAAMDHAERLLQVLAETLRAVDHRFANRPGDERDGVLHRLIGRQWVEKRLYDGLVEIGRARTPTPEAPHD